MSSVLRYRKKILSHHLLVRNIGYQGREMKKGAGFHSPFDKMVLLRRADK